MKTTEREHYTSIAPDESDHIAAMCGCTLDRDEQGIVRMYQCALHENAPAMLTALRAAQKTIELALAKASQTAARRGGS